MGTLAHVKSVTFIVEALTSSCTLALICKFIFPWLAVWLVAKGECSPSLTSSMGGSILIFWSVFSHYGINVVLWRSLHPCPISYSYRVKVYSNERSPCSKFCEANGAYSWSFEKHSLECYAYIWGKKLCITLYQRLLEADFAYKDIANVIMLASYTILTVACHSL